MTDVDTTTPIVGLIKPGFDGPADIREINTDLDKIDARFGTLVGALINPMTSPGDLIRGGTAGAPTRLGVGSATQVLTVQAGLPAWVAPTYGGMTNPMTGPGDLIAGGTGGAANRLAVGAEGQVLAVVGGMLAWAANVAPANLLTNSGFEVWQRGNGPFATAGVYTADRWWVSVAGGTFTLTRDAVNADAGSQYCAQVVAAGAGADVLLEQNLEEWAQLRGRTLTVAVRVRSSVVGAVRLASNDGLSGWVYGPAANTQTGVYETLAYTFAVPTGATQVVVAVRIAPAATVQVDSATCCVGTSPAPYTPLPATTEVGRCMRYYQEVGGQEVNEQIILLQATGATTALGPLQFVVPVAAVPTTTVSAPGDFELLGPSGTPFAVSALAFPSTTRRGTRVSATVAGGLGVGNAAVLRAANLNARIRFDVPP